MNRSSRGAWLLVAILLALLVVAGGYAYQGLTFGGQVDIPIEGYIALALGIVLSLVVGIGLMALVFYSSRSGYDEPPRQDPTDQK